MICVQRVKSNNTVVPAEGGVKTIHTRIKACTEVDELLNLTTLYMLRDLVVDKARTTRGPLRVEQRPIDEVVVRAVASESGREQLAPGFLGTGIVWPGNQRSHEILSEGILKQGVGSRALEIALVGNHQRGVIRKILEELIDLGRQLGLFGRHDVRNVRTHKYP